MDEHVPKDLRHVFRLGQDFGETPDNRERGGLDGRLPQQGLVAGRLPLELDLQPLPVKDRYPLVAHGCRGSSRPPESRVQGLRGIAQVGGANHKRVGPHVAGQFSVRLVHVGRGDEHDRDRGQSGITASLAAEREAVHRRHHDVRQNGVRWPAPGQLKALRASGCRLNFVPCLFQLEGGELAVRLLVVED